MSTRRRFTLRQALLMLAGVVAIVYLGIIAYVMMNERAFIYQPDYRAVEAPNPGFSLHQREVSYPSSNGVTLSAWIVPAAEWNASSMWLLICHGNLGNIGYAQRPEFYADMRDLGLNLFAFDYRGYGASSGEPDEQGLYADASASYAYLTRTLGVPPSHVVIFGHSLGSGVAIELASRVPAAGLVVEGAYTSVTDRGSELYPFLPVGLMSSQRFPSLERITRVAMPKLFLHSPEDSVIPYAHGRRLFDAADGRKTFIDVRGGHENAFRVDKAVYDGAMREFLRTVTP